MTLILEIAAGYLLGRLLAHISSIFGAVIMRRILESSPKFRQLVREDMHRDERLQRDLKPIKAYRAGRERQAGHPFSPPNTQ